MLHFIGWGILLFFGWIISDIIAAILRNERDKNLPEDEPTTEYEKNIRKGLRGGD